MIAQFAVVYIQFQLPAFGLIQEFGIEYESILGNESLGAVDDIVQFARRKGQPMACAVDPPAED